MNKRVVAVVLAGAMVASQLAGSVEVLATNTAGEAEATASKTPDKMLEEGVGVDTPVETAKDNSVQTQAVVKGWLKADNKVYEADTSGAATTTEITNLDTVTDLLVENSVTSIPNDLFKGKATLTNVEIMGASGGSTASPGTNTTLTSIGTSAFEGTGLTTFVLPGALTSIGASAFKNTKALATVDLSGAAGLTTIGNNAFEGSGVVTVTIPAAVNSLGTSAFKDAASLTTINLTGAAALTTIEANSFENSGLTTVAIPATVTGIGNAAFKGSRALATVDFSGAGKLATIGDSAFENVSGLRGDVNLSTTVVTAIGNNAFMGTEISEVVLPATLLTIGNSTFQNVTNLLTVDFSKALAMTSIGTSAFESTAISVANFPSTLSTIGSSAFKSTADLASVDFSTSTGITSIGTSAFEGSGLATLDLAPITVVVDVQDRAFKNNVKLQTAKLPEKMANLKAEVLAGTALTTLEINKDAAAVDLTALPNTLETITVNAGNTTFAAADGVLYNTGITTLKAFPKAKAGEFELPATVTTIDANAAKGNTGLTKVSLASGSGLTDIEASAFEGATGLKLLDLVNGTSLANVKGNAFKNSGLEQMYLGKTTNDFTAGTGIGADAFASVSTTKVAKFLESNGTEIAPGADLTALETKWAALKDAAKGGWTFYVKPTKPATPDPTANYTDMKLENLTAGLVYNIVVDGQTEEHTADTAGKIDIKKEWGGKTIAISTKPTVTHLESDAKDVIIKSIYTVTLDGTAKNTAEGESVSHTALDQVGQTFIKWTAEGVELQNANQKTITFTMPANDVILRKVYKTTNTVAPTAAASYADMTLTGLSPNEAYTIENEEMTSDSTGKVAIKKEWGGKTISIVKNETETETESPAQSLVIMAIYSITVGETEVAISVKDEAVTITAPTPEGHLFKEWTDGYSDITVTAGDKTTETITFTMLDKDVTLKAVYTTIVVTKPEEMVYDGEKETSVEFDVPFANFDGIEVGGVMLVKDKDYTVSEGPVATLASGKTIVKFAKTYLDSLEKGVNAFKAVLKDGKKVDFSIKVVEKPTVPEKPPVVFPDVNAKEWYAKAVDYVSSKEYMTGFANGNFGPADTLGRGQFASILYRMAGSPVQNYENLFADVPNGTFYTMPVVWAQKNNVIKGYQNGNFGPADSMTREQLVTMLYRYTQIKGGNTVARASIENYPDKAKVSGFAVEAMQWGVAEGLVSGDNGTLNPQGAASRAVAATLIQRFEMKQKPPVTPPVTPPTP